MTSNRKALVLYRLEQADESLESARILLAESKYRPSVSRAYYAMFYAVLALLAVGGHGTSKHAAVISLFDRDFVKKDIFDREFSRWFHEAFALRQRADYREMVVISADRAQPVLERAMTFVSKIKERIEVESS